LIINDRPTATATIALPQLINIFSPPLAVTVDGDLVPVGFVDLPVPVVDNIVVAVPLDQCAVLVALPVTALVETCGALFSVVDRAPLQVPLRHVFVAHWLFEEHVAWKEPHLGTSIELTA
jgi:hypothetical protein